MRNVPGSGANRGRWSSEWFDRRYRNLMAMDVEESIRAYPLDGVILLTGCDKTNPASILGAASAKSRRSWLPAGRC
jgi:dihydroxyacid dehydratase/phosphogluconate dehydratase